MTAKERIEKAIEARSQAKPGPWKFVHGNKIIDNSGEVVAMVAGKWKQDEMEANRNIIAAAPDLVDEVVKLRKIIATLSRRANKLERDGVVRMTAEERGKWLDKQCEELEKRDENIAEGYGLERKWFAEAQEAKE